MQTPCISNLFLLEQLITNLEPLNSTHLLSRSSLGQKSNTRFPGLTCLQGSVLSADSRDEPITLSCLASRSCQHSLACGLFPLSSKPVALHLSGPSVFALFYDHSWGTFSTFMNGTWPSSQML